MRKCIILLFITLTFSSKSYSGCLKVGLLGEFNTTTNKTSIAYGREIKAGIEIAKRKLKRCMDFLEIDINNNIANINDLIKKYNEDGVFVYIGLGTTEQVLASLEGLKQTQSVLLSPTATSDVIYEKSSNVILLSPTNKKIVKKIISEIEKRKIKKVLMIYSSNDPYSKSIRDIMEAESKDRLTLKSSGVFLGKGASLNELSSVSLDSYDAVFLPLFEHEVLKVMSYLKRLNKDIKLIGSDSWGTHSRIINTLPMDQKKNILFTASLFPTFLESVYSGYFYKEYKILNLKEPTDLSAFSYDSVKAIDLAYDCLQNRNRNRNILCFHGVFESSTGIQVKINAQSVNRDVFIKEKL